MNMELEQHFHRIVSSRLFELEHRVSQIIHKYVVVLNPQLVHPSYNPSLSPIHLPKPTISTSQTASQHSPN